MNPDCVGQNRAGQGDSGCYGMLAGKRIGVITNHSAMSSSGHTALDELRGLSAFTVGAVFAPEHEREYSS